MEFMNVRRKLILRLSVLIQLDSKCFDNEDKISMSMIKRYKLHRVLTLYVIQKERVHYSISIHCTDERVFISIPTYVYLIHTTQ